MEITEEQSEVRAVGLGTLPKGLKPGGSVLIDLHFSPPHTS